VVKHSRISPDRFNPLTSKEFEVLEKERHQKRIDDLKSMLDEHRKLFESLIPADFRKRLSKSRVGGDSTAWMKRQGLSFMWPIGIR